MGGTPLTAGKSINLNVRVWYDDKSRHIKLAGQGLTASTVSNDPSSKRYHPNLFRKLATALRNAGVPAPDAPEPARKTLDGEGGIIDNNEM